MGGPRRCLLGHRVLGTRETVSALTRDQMQHYFDRRYSASNTVVCAAGAVDFDRFVDHVRACCASWTSGEVARAHPPFHAHEERLLVPMKQANRAYLAWLCPAPAVQDPRRYAAAMLAQILGDSEGSRLYWALVETGIAEEAQAQYDGHDGIGEYVTYVACSPDDVARVDAIVQSERSHGSGDQQSRDMGFCLKRNDLERARTTLQPLLNQWPGASFEEGMAIARISAVGAGMPCTTGTAARMFRSLADAGVNIEMIATSEIRTSCVVPEAKGVKALQVVHAAFGLGGAVQHQAQGTEAPV